MCNIVSCVRSYVDVDALASTPETPVSSTALAAATAGDQSASPGTPRTPVAQVTPKTST